jgi:hypothetical protein
MGAAFATPRRLTAFPSWIENLTDRPGCKKFADYSISLGSQGSRFVNFMLQKNAGLGQGVFQPIIGISTKL